MGRSSQDGQASRCTLREILTMRFSFRALAIVTVVIAGCSWPRVHRQCSNGENAVAQMRHAHMAVVTTQPGGWRSTGIVLSQGEPLGIVATGSLVTGQQCGPAGMCRDVVGTEGAHLVARVGEGQPFAVHGCWFGLTPDDGVLSLDIEGATGGTLDVAIGWGQDATEGLPADVVAAGGGI